MEPFAQLVVVGGLALLVGLWTLGLAAAFSPAWLGGAALVGAGVAGLTAGIGREFDLDR